MNYGGIIVTILGVVDKMNNDITERYEETKKRQNLTSDQETLIIRLREDIEKLQKMESQLRKEKTKLLKVILNYEIFEVKLDDKLWNCNKKIQALHDEFDDIDRSFLSKLLLPKNCDLSNDSDLAFILKTVGKSLLVFAGGALGVAALSALIVIAPLLTAGVLASASAIFLLTKNERKNKKLRKTNKLSMELHQLKSQRTADSVQKDRTIALREEANNRLVNIDVRLNTVTKTLSTKKREYISLFKDNNEKESGPTKNDSSNFFEKVKK